MDRLIHDRIFDLAYQFTITCICTYMSFVLYIHVYTIYIFIYLYMYLTQLDFGLIIQMTLNYKFIVANCSEELTTDFAVR